MTPPRTLILALLLFLPSVSLHAQDKPPSAATLIEKARILAEEKADPKAAIKLLVDQVICRNDLSKAQFDKAAQMIALYGGGKPPAANSRSATSPPPRQDLTRLIEKEIDSYLAGDTKAVNKIFWYEKAAVPVLISRLKRDYFKAEVADRLVPLIVSRLDTRAAADFLRQLREKGPERFRTIVAKTMNTSRSNVGSDPMGPLMDEIIVWIRTQKEGALLLDWFWQDVKPDDLTLLLDRRSSDWNPLRVAYLLTHRGDVVRLENPQPLFRIVLQEVARAHAGQAVANMGNDIFAWLLHQEGGFEVFAQALGVPDWYIGRNDSLVKGALAFPDAEEGLVTLLSQIKNWRRYRKPYEFLDYCLRKVWKDPIHRPTPALQQSLLECMDTLNRLYRETEIGGTTSQENAMQGIWRMLKGRLLLIVARADPSFQESLWEKAIGIGTPLTFVAPLKGDPGRSRGWGVEALFLDGIDGGKPWISTTMSDDTKVRLCVRSLERNNWSSFDYMFQNSEDFSFSKVMRQRFLRRVLARRALWKALLSEGGTEWWVVLPQNEAKSFLSTVLEDSSFSEDEISDLLYEAFMREAHPVSFLAWVRKKRSGLTPRPFLNIDYNGLRKDFVDTRLIDALLDWIEVWIEKTPSVVATHDEGVSALSDFAAQLSPFPSKKSQAFMARLLLSSRGYIRKIARGILDDWSLVEETRKKGDDEDIRTALWKKTDKSHTVIVRTLVLKGLFDLGDKRAWLVLSDWLESKDAALKEAAEELAGEIRAGK